MQKFREKRWRGVAGRDGKIKAQGNAV